MRTPCLLAAAAILASTSSARADDEGVDKYGLGTEVLLGFTHLLDKDATAGDSTTEVGAIGVRASKRFENSHFTLSASYIHHNQLKSTAFAGPYQFEWLGLGGGYEIDARRLLIRPELLLGVGVPHIALKDTVDTDGSPDTTTGLVFGGGIGVRYPSDGRWYVGLDAQTLYKSRDQGPLWLFSGYASLGVRWEI